MDNPGTTSVSLIAEDTTRTMTALSHNKRTRRVVLLMVMLFLVSMWLGSIVFNRGNKGIKDAIFVANEELNGDGKDDVEEKDWDYKEEAEEDEEYDDDEEEYDDGEGEDYDDKEGKEYEEDEEEYDAEEDDDDDQELDMNMIEAALMEEDDRKIDEGPPESVPQDSPLDAQQSHKVERSVVQDIDFSILTGEKDWDKENPFPKIRFDLRQKLMEERCQTADTRKETFSIIKTNKIGIFFKQKASACLVNKSGSTTWRAHLQRVNQARSIYQQKDKRWKAFMSQPNLSEAMVETSRIITVRHPLTRLVSAYRQRFNNGKPVSLNIWNRRIKQHVKKYFSNYWLPAIISNNVIPAEERTRLGVPYKHRLGKIYSTTMLKKVHQKVGSGFSITFPMFLRHVIYTLKNNIVDNHWKPIEWLCSPCLLHYEHIVKLETMTEDVKHVFDELKIPSNAEMRKNKESYGQNPWGDLKHYENVPLDLKKDIIRLYWNDFYLFGYKLPPGFLEE